MKRMICIAALLMGCGTDGQRVEDGGLVGADGWPVRASGEQRRCPMGTDLIDERLPDGRRTITCKSKASPIPKGFLITWYAGGALATESVLDENGRPESRKTWHPDGSVESEETYKEGRVLRRVAYFPDGSQQEIVERTATGALLKRFRPGGGVELQGEIIGENRVGTWKIWSDGAEESVEYVEGKKSGSVTREYPDGSKESGFYDDGERDLNWERVGPNGLPVLVQTYKAGKLEGTRTAYFPTGQPREVTNFRAGQRHGTYQKYHTSGELAERGEFACDKEHGDWVLFHEDGSVKAKGSFVDGQRSGEWTYYFQTGEVERVVAHEIVKDSKCVAEASSENPPEGSPAPR